MSRLSAGVVPIRYEAGAPRFLLLRAYRYWDFPKGGVEAGEDPLEAALREAREEAGLSDLVFTWGPVFRETPPYSRGKVARYYLAEAREWQVVMGVNPALGRPEHHEYRWVSHAEAHALLVPRVRAILDWAQGVVGC